MRTRSQDPRQVATALLGVALVTAILSGLGVTNAATVSTTYLMVVLLVATTSRLRVAVLTSILAMLCLNFFFLPPVRTFTIADPQNWVALVAFVAVSLVASHLSSVARQRTDEALARRNELTRLFDLGRDVLTVTDSRGALPALARAVGRRFDLASVSIALPRDDTWEVHPAGAQSAPLDTRQLASAFAAAQSTLEFDAYLGTYAGHRIASVDGREVHLVPLRAGTRPIGILAAGGRSVEPGTLEALAGLVALAVERVHLLEETRAGELARQGEQLKTALLASLSHDLRTPLTAIRVAASNIASIDLAPHERVEQCDVILAEASRLTRLFENVLDMARIDAGAVAREARPTHPSEIVAAARDQVAPALASHPLDVQIAQDVPVRLDPRLTASALAHLLENAGQYAPAGTPIHLTTTIGREGLTIRVRDHGPGLSAADLPHVFERFYRGSAARTRTSGTGMGLWIVRGLLAAQQGRVWAENSAGGGAQFTIVVPVGTPTSAPEVEVA